MYGTINTLFKEYIQSVDCTKRPELLELGKKYYSKALFSVDNHEHKKILKRKFRDEHKIK